MIPRAQQPFDFSGSTYEPERDQQRLSGQISSYVRKNGVSVKSYARKFPTLRPDDKRFGSNKIILGEKLAVLVCPLQGRRNVNVSVLIDKSDLPAVSQLTWRARLDRTSTGIYVLGTLPKVRKAIQLHRFILGVRSQVDHRNHRGTDNRRCNIRPATPSQNGANRRPTNRLGLKGVRLDKGRYEARITLEGDTCFLGSFDTAKEAARAYDEAAIKHFGEFAYVNFPNEVERQHLHEGLHEYRLLVRRKA